jgi:tetratricopeptide (TPR) repeat protein
MKKTLFISILFLVLFLVSCNKEKDPYETEIQNLITNKNYTQALELVNLHEEENKNSNKNYIYYKIIALNKLQRNTEALKLCNEYISNNSNVSDYYDLKATILTDLGNLYPALSSINKAISIENKNMYLNNKSFILNTLGKYSNAQESAKTVIKNDSDFDMAYVNLGYSTFYLNNSLKTIEEYNKSISLNPYNDIAFYNKACHLLIMGNYEDALLSINSALNIESDNLKYLNKKADIEIKSGNFNDATNTLKEAKNLNNRYEETYINMALLNLNTNNLDKALDYINYIETLTNYTNTYIPIKSKILSANGENQKALNLCIDSISEEINNSELYNVMGEIHKSDFNFSEAMLYFEKSIVENSMNVDAYINKASLLYDKHNYNNCINFSNESLELFPYSSTLYNYIALSYSKLSKHEEAIDIYKEIIKQDYNNKNLYLNLAKEYKYINDIEKSLLYTEEALDIDSEFKKAKELKESLNSIKDDTDNIYKFISENYLFSDKTNNLDYINNTNYISNSKIDNYINKIKYKDDYYTSFVQNKNYKMLKKYNEIETINIDKINNNLYYLKLESFNFSTGVKVIENLENLYFTENKNIILDLRNNNSGILSPVYDILDCLLPSCTSNYEISQNGDMSQIKSDYYSIKFNKIFIIVNENSYSSSELLAASLKKNLNNVTILGTSTLGNHIAQKIYENSNNEYYIYLSSFYWSLNKNKSDLSEGIYPDININASNKSFYINEVIKHID